MCCSCFIVHCIALLCTVYCVVCGDRYVSVYGEGLGLRGPPGSLVRCVEAMASIRFHYIYLFHINLIALLVSFMSMYWILVDFTMAMILMVGTVCAILASARVLSRIYDRLAMPHVSSCTTMCLHVFPPLHHCTTLSLYAITACAGRVPSLCDSIFDVLLLILLTCEGKVTRRTQPFNVSKLTLMRLRINEHPHLVLTVCV
jgi:hypothetical protein